MLALLQQFIPNLDTWLSFGLALALGGLVGLEREYAQQQIDQEANFAGIRTFPLISLLGCTTAFASQELDSLLIYAVALGGMAVLTAVAYMRRLSDERSEGITTEVTVLLVFILGSMAIWGDATLASALTVIVTILLSLKRSLHEMARRLSHEDLLATLQFALITAVILPLLPNQTLDPLGVVNPYRIWLLVVLISGLGFGGYVAIRVFGAHRAIWMTGLLGGIVSSTATTLSFAGRSHKTPHLAPGFAVAILLASTIMYPRVAILLLVVRPSLFWAILPYLTLLLVAGLGACTLLWRVSRVPDEPGSMELSNPLNFKGALQFTAAFVVILFAVKLADIYFGTVGVYVTSLLSGLVNMSATVLSVADVSQGGALGIQTGTIAILLSMLGNGVAKAVLAYSLGARSMRRPITLGFGILFVANVVALAAAGAML